MTVPEVKAKVKAGDFPINVGGGLALQANLSWVYTFRMPGEGDLKRSIVCGKWPDGWLAGPKEKRDEYDKLRKAGINPVDERRGKKAEAEGLTFAQYAAKHVDDITRYNAVERRRWLGWMTTKKWLGDLIDMQPAAITADDVLRALATYWDKHPPTSIKLRKAIVRVLDSAKARKLITDPNWTNPATFRGNLQHLKKTMPHQVQPRRAVAVEKVPTFIALLQAKQSQDQHYGGSMALALEWLTLTAARLKSVLMAQWREIDLSARTWTIPGHKLKQRADGLPVPDHVIPLTVAMFRVLRRSLPRRGKPRPDGFIFPAPRSEAGHHWNATANTYLGRLWPDADCHGLRASFATWAEVETDFSDKVIDLCLGHTKRAKKDDEVGNVFHVYARGQFARQRRKLMRQWSAYCTTPPAAPLALAA